MTKEYTYFREAEYLRTADLSLASAIYLSEPLAAIDKQDPRRAEFIFKRSSELDQLVERFWRGELRVDPRRHFAAIREIKARLYSR